MEPTDLDGDAAASEENVLLIVYLNYERDDPRAWPTAEPDDLPPDGSF